MKVLKFREAENTLKVRVDTAEDLWTIQRIVFPGDRVKSESVRRFRASEGDKGELKDVVILLKVEKTEFDKTAVRLRIMGKIIDGKPLDYVKLNSYHTLNIGLGDELVIGKDKWHDYMVRVIRNAVSDTKKARLGMIVVDDEKAMPATLLGYGVQFGNEIQSRLSKRMSQKDFTEQQKRYYDAVLEVAAGMKADTVIIAGPGFAKDDIKKHAEETGFAKKAEKKIVYGETSNSERSGIYELIKGEKVEQLLAKERIRIEFKLMEEFLNGLQTGRSKSGPKEVTEAIEDYGAKMVLVNDQVLGNLDVQKALDAAERNDIKIEVINSDDEVGAQLHYFKDIGCF